MQFQQCNSYITHNHFPNRNLLDLDDDNDSFLNNKYTRGRWMMRVIGKDTQYEERQNRIDDIDRNTL